MRDKEWFGKEHQRYLKTGFDTLILATANFAAMAAAAPETPRPVSQEKYVVWSGSGDTPRSGPDDR